MEWAHGLFKDRTGRRPLCPELVRVGGGAGVELRDLIWAGLCRILCVLLRMKWSICLFPMAAITNAHKLGVLKEIYSLTVLGVRSPKSVLSG